jgi:transitional endoplasmic reticulum ATPase
MRKVACAPNINFDALGHATEGFSGADIAEVCNRATRYAIKLCLAEHVEREKKKEVYMREGLPIPAELDDESLYTVTQAHFSLAMREARKSVSEADIARYTYYAQSNAIQAGRAFGDSPGPGGGRRGGPNFGGGPGNEYDD